MRWNVIRQSWRSVLDTVVLLLVAAAAVAVLWRVATGPTVNGVATTASATESAAQVALPSEPISLEGAAVLGDAKASVVLVEYSDFQCSFCAKFALEVLPRLEERYVKSGQLLIAFRHFPIEKTHPLARRAAEVSVCAAKEGRFWPMHHLLFQRQRDLSNTVMSELAAGLGLDRARLEACRTAESKKVQDDMGSGRRLAVRGTPTIFLGHRDESSLVRVRARISGAGPFERLDAIISDLLKKGN